jgi:ribosome-associated protein YbcJ (S4-like RNA binding protein)
LTSSYAINSTIQGQLAGVASSSAQVKAFLPADTVSSSGQVSLTATTGFSTFSSSIATKNDLQDVSINSLNAATSSYAINATIQGQLAGVASSSAQVKAFLPADTVSSSAQVKAFLPADTVSSSTQFNNLTSPFTGSFTGSFKGDGSGLTGVTAAGTVSSSVQIDITQTTGYTTFSQSLATVDQNQQSQIGALIASTSSYALQSQLAGVASSSGQVKAYLPDGTVSSSAQYPGWVTASSQIDITATTGYSTFSSSLSTVDANQQAEINALKNVTGSYATTGSNTFRADQTITGSLYISQNLYVQGSSSISYISQSTLNIGTNVITVNTLTPGTRFGGLSVIDSGSSPQRSGSLFFDSTNDQWIFIHQNQTTPTSSVLIMGPQTFNNIGNETTLTTNVIPKSTNAEHIGDSQISDNGVTVSITNGLSVGTNLTASQADITTVRSTTITATGTVSASTSAFINNAIYSGSVVTNIIGPVSNQVVASIPAASCDGAFFDYIVKDGTNYRTGTVMVIEDGTSVEFTDVSTNDIGNTAQAIFTVDIVGGLLRLKFTNSSGTWTVKTIIRAL